MEFKIPHLIVVPTAQTALPTAGTATTDLTADRFGIFDSTSRLSVTAPALPTNRSVFFAQYSGDNSIGTFKSPKVSARNITGWRGVQAICSGTNQITYVGFDEVEDSKTLASDCNEYYTVTIRLTNERSRILAPAGFTKSYSVKTTCCADCESPCQTVDCNTSADAIIDQINNDPWLAQASGTQLITASKVTKCSGGSPATIVYTLTLPDPGTSVGTITDITFTNAGTQAGLTTGTETEAQDSTSGSGTGATFDVTIAGGVITAIAINNAGTGYEIGDTITILGGSFTSGVNVDDNVVITVTETTGAEGALLGEIRDMYTSFVSNPETSIIYSADVDSSDNDTNSTGNVRIELTPSAGVALSSLPDYNGISWESVTLVASTETCVCGIKLEGAALDEFGNTCVPTAFPYIFDAVTFEVFTSKGPATTSDFEVYENCDAWPVTTTQIVTYPIGSGKGFSDIEREIFSYYNTAKINYINPLYNFGWTPKVDPDKFYDAYYLDFYTQDNTAFSDISKQEAQVIVLFEHECPTDTKTAGQTAFETAVNAYVAESGFPAVAL